MPKRLNKPLYITSPFKNIAIASTIVKNCKIYIGDRELVTDLVQLDIHDFDIIFGMNYYRHTMRTLIILEKEWCSNFWMSRSSSFRVMLLL